MGTTVLLVTHAVHRLSYADQIIALSSDGSIAEQGSLKDLDKSGGYVSLLRAQYSDTANQEEKDIPVKPSGMTLAGSEPINGTDTMAEELKRGSGDLSLYSYYFGSVHWASSCLFLTAWVVAGMAVHLDGLVVNMWTSDLEKHGSSVNGMYLGIYAMVTVVSCIALVGGAYHFMLYFTPRSALKMHERLLKAVMNAPLAFFTSVDTGTTTNR